MSSIGIPEISGVRIGRHVRLFVDAQNQEDAYEKVDEACKKLLANLIMETYSFKIETV
jgi:phosphoribosylformylglycinamidine synthase